jgi:hypothetical protein
VNIGLAPNMLVTESELHHYINMNGWYWFNAQRGIPDEGWKIHVSGDAANAVLIYRKVLPVLRQHNVVHSFYQPSRLFRASTAIKPERSCACIRKI